MLYRVTDILWDTDAEDVVLPEEVIVAVADDADPAEVEDILSDEITEQTDWCHRGFAYETVSLAELE